MLKILSGKNTVLICLGFFFLFAGFSASQQYLVPLLTLEGKGQMALYSLLLIYSSFTISTLFAPKLIEVMGEKLALIFGAVSYGIFSLSLLSFELLLYPASILIGIGASLVWVASTRIITVSTENHLVGSVLGLQRSSFSIGALFGISAGSLFLETIDIASLYMIFALLSFASLFFFVFLDHKKDKITKEKILNFSYLLDKKLLLLSPVVFATFYLSGLSFSAINLIALSFSLGFVGFLSTIGRASVILGDVITGRLSDILNKKMLLYLFVSLTILGCFLIFIKFNIIIITLGAILIGFGMSSVYPICLSLIKERFTLSEYNKASAIFFLYTGIGAMSALLTTTKIDPNMTLIPAIIFLIISLPSIFLFNKLVQ